MLQKYNKTSIFANIFAIFTKNGTFLAFFSQNIRQNSQKCSPKQSIFYILATIQTNILS